MNNSGLIRVSTAGVPIECSTCPCGTPAVCGVCSTAGTVPSQFQVVISAVTGFCSTLNGTYTLTYSTCGWDCDWHLTLPSTGPCGADRLSLYFSGGNPMHVDFGSDFCIAGPLDGMYFQQTIASTDDCGALVDFDVPHVGGACCGSTDTPVCRVTAL